jgi:chromosome segregation ATPase
MDKVIEGVEKMITELEVQERDHKAKKDECDTQSAELEAATDATEADLKDLDTQVATLEEKLEELEEDITGLNAELNETQGEIKSAGEDRAAENADFQNAIANQHAAQQVLQMAVNRMQMVYDLLQQERPVTRLTLLAARSAATVRRSRSAAKGGGAVKMLEEIIEDSKAMVKDAEAAEKKSQEAYADFVENCNGALKVVFASLTDKKIKRGAGEAELIQKKEAQSSATKQLDDLKKQAETLKSACETLVKNFDTVKEARAGEIDALKQSMGILSEAANSTAPA